LIFLKKETLERSSDLTLRYQVLFYIVLGLLVIWTIVEYVKPQNNFGTNNSVGNKSYATVDDHDIESYGNLKIVTSSSGHDIHKSNMKQTRSYRLGDIETCLRDYSLQFHDSLLRRSHKHTHSEKKDTCDDCDYDSAICIPVPGVSMRKTRLAKYRSRIAPNDCTNCHIP